MENNRGCLLDKKNSTKGFTLIELLAVIVILAIIALITVPLILNVINDSKEKSRLRSIENIESQAYFYYTKHALVSDQVSGNIFNQVMETIKGEKPESGEIFIKSGKQIGYALKYNNICYKKGYSESVVRKLENEEECTLINTKNYLKKAGNTNQDSTFLGGNYREENSRVHYFFRKSRNGRKCTWILESF